ncbi:MAG: hypothetical protein AUG51_00390 [Acidobacteria bacterium 13_1_20CM_3_53_8]|nr:MAG: hypothetical protein AUG51_00390 [Acidobacteria bacterium 13_1_20CM_3_53_8]
MALTNLLGQTLDEKYLIERELGRGGMGAVYLATHVGTGRVVAVKVIAPEFMRHSEFVERFKREARAAGRLRHPNVVDVTDFGFARVGAERVAYLVMEYLDGCTLAEILAEESSLPLNWVVDILEQTCSAVESAHRQGIIHRDLKPDNIWLEPNQRGGYTVKVLDFGIAKLAEQADQGLEEQAAHTPNKSDSSTNSQTHHSSSLELPTLALASSSTPTDAAESTGATSHVRQTASSSLLDTELNESATLLQPASTKNTETAEAATRLLSHAVDDEEAGTRILEPRTTTERNLSHTASASSLTRVGATLGTPLYMSPEQWRGEQLDARSDIYSLGVIAYQMLSGRTPFKGDLTTVSRETQAAPPPLLKMKNVPKKFARVVLSALAKKPEDRPSTALALASALRAHSESAIMLLRHALTLFSEHMPVFLRLALLVSIPMIVVNLMQLALGLFVARQAAVSRTVATGGGLVLSVSKTTTTIASFVLSLITLLVAILTAAILTGVTTRLVTQLLAQPLRPIQLRPAFSALKRRLRPFLTTAFLVSLLSMIGMILGLIPGLIVLVNYSMVTPVMMMEEGMSGRAAMRRARTLSKRSRPTVIFIILFQIAVPILTALLLAFLIISVIKAFAMSGSHANTFSLIYQVIQMPMNILFGSFSAIVTALLYLKTRLAGGETLRDALGQFDSEELPQRRWQKRMRERLQVTIRQTRH